MGKQCNNFHLWATTTGCVDFVVTNDDRMINDPGYLRIDGHDEGYRAAEFVFSTSTSQAFDPVAALQRLVSVLNKTTDETKITELGVFADLDQAMEWLRGFEASLN